MYISNIIILCDVEADPLKAELIIANIAFVNLYFKSSYKILRLNYSIN